MALSNWGAAMDLHLVNLAKDKYVTVDGLRMRYLEEGSGRPVLLLHGASLGSSADVYRRHLPAFAKAGLRAIAVDFPGYGASEVGDDLSTAFQLASVPKFIEALGLDKPALVAHSRSGALALQLALKEPDRYSHLVALGTNLLLPPLTDEVEGRDARLTQRIDRRLAATEPTLDDTRKLMEADLFHTELVTPDELALRHRNSVGKPFLVFTERANAGELAPPSGEPLWRRILDLKVPLLLIIGREDRSSSRERAELMKKLHPEVNVHLVSECKHMVPWDAEQEVYRLAIPFIQAREASLRAGA